MEKKTRCLTSVLDHSDLVCLANNAPFLYNEQVLIHKRKHMCVRVKERTQLVAFFLYLLMYLLSGFFVCISASDIRWLACIYRKIKISSLFV